jgi:hypothetical protein
MTDRTLPLKQLERVLSMTAQALDELEERDSHRLSPPETWDPTRNLSALRAISAIVCKIHEAQTQQPAVSVNLGGVRLDTVPLEQLRKVDRYIKEIEERTKVET